MIALVSLFVGKWLLKIFRGGNCPFCPTWLRPWAHALKSCGTFHKKLWHISQTIVACALKSCGTCLVFSWHMSQLFRARVTTIQGMCHNFSGHVPQLFVACATAFRGMCHNFLWHVPQLFGACTTTFCGTCPIICGIFLTFCGTCPIFCGMWHADHYPSSGPEMPLSASVRPWPGGTLKLARVEFQIYLPYDTLQRIRRPLQCKNLPLKIGMVSCNEYTKSYLNFYIKIFYFL